MVGPSTTSTPFALASPASSFPISPTNASSQLAARAVGLGRLVVVSSCPIDPPFTPAGPSDTTTGLRPISGMACVFQKSTPVSKRTLVSRSSRAMALATAASTTTS